MAEYTGMIEAANAFVELLRDNMTPEPISKPDLIGLCSPYESEDNQLTVYLYHIEEDEQNATPGYITISRDTQRRAPTVVRLYFLITAHSKAPAKLREADRYRILGKAVQTISENPSIDEKYLGGSLKDTGAELRLSLQKPSHEQLMKIWNNTSTPYKLSIVCQLSGVAIDSHKTRSVSRVTDVEINVKETRSGEH